MCPTNKSLILFDIWLVLNFQHYDQLYIVKRIQNTFTLKYFLKNDDVLKFGGSITWNIILETTLERFCWLYTKRWDSIEHTIRNQVSDFMKEKITKDFVCKKLKGLICFCWFYVSRGSVSMSISMLPKHIHNTMVLALALALCIVYCVCGYKLIQHQLYLFFSFFFSFKNLDYFSICAGHPCGGPIYIYLTTSHLL